MKQTSSQYAGQSHEAVRARSREGVTAAIPSLTGTPSRSVRLLELSRIQMQLVMYCNGESKNLKEKQLRSLVPAVIKRLMFGSGGFSRLVEIGLLHRARWDGSREAFPALAPWLNHLLFWQGVRSRVVPEWEGETGVRIRIRPGLENRDTEKNGVNGMMRHIWQIRYSSLEPPLLF